MPLQNDRTKVDSHVRFMSKAHVGVCWCLDVFGLHWIALFVCFGGGSDWRWSLGNCSGKGDVNDKLD